MASLLRQGGPPLREFGIKFTPGGSHGAFVAKIATLKVRAQFQRVRGGGRATAVGFILEGKVRAQLSLVGDLNRPQVVVAGARFGFTITKKIGNAVTRNLIRRRFRAALGEISAQHERADTDYVLVARAPAAVQDFQMLKRDLITALKRVNSALGSHLSHSKVLGHDATP